MNDITDKILVWTCAETNGFEYQRNKLTLSRKL
jgi:hypothetical protein